ncbi:hypothetical protein AB0M46_38860 [Dactylosporangium sp. NPDC051485]|uniref:hypothetical protein n=1 Tax=Dactylosporangium sp. NPDC051485 TaxID=3154846 RepID=UPI003422944F
MSMTNRADPSSVERAGAALAQLAAAYRPTLLVSWSATLDVLLAHVVARQLGIRRVEADIDLGRLLLDGNEPSEWIASERTVLIANDVTADQPVGPLVAAMMRGGGRVVAVCSVRPVTSAHPALDGVAMASLDHTP